MAQLTFLILNNYPHSGVQKPWVFEGTDGRALIFGQGDGGSKLFPLLYEAGELQAEIVELGGKFYAPDSLEKVMASLKTGKRGEEAELEQEQELEREEAADVEADQAAAVGSTAGATTTSAATATVANTTTATAAAETEQQTEAIRQNRKEELKEKKMRHDQRRILRKRFRRILTKVHDMVNSMHYEMANFLVANYRFAGWANEESNLCLTTLSIFFPQGSSLFPSSTRYR